MSIRIALIVSSPIELTLTAGREEIEPSLPEPSNDPPFLNLGRAEGEEIHLTGPLVGDPDHLAAGLSIAWYLPDEEKEEQAREIDVAQALALITAAERPPADEGWRWHYRLETRRPFRTIYIFEQGFQPPFKASDIALNIEHLANFNYDGYIVSSLTYLHRAPTYQESDWRFPTVEAEGRIG